MYFTLIWDNKENVWSSLCTECSTCILMQQRWRAFKIISLMVFTINICQLHYLNLLCVDYSYMKLFFVFSWELTWFNSREALYLPNGRPRFGNRFDFPGILPEKTEHVIQVIYLVTVGEGTDKWEQRERTAELSHKPLQRSPASKLCCHQGWEQQTTRGCGRTIYLQTRQKETKKQSPFWWDAAFRESLICAIQSWSPVV